MCSDTKPAFLASVVAKWPLICFLLLFVGLLAFAAPTIVFPKYRPKLNSEFDSLLVKDDDTAKFSAAVKTLDGFNNFFWSSELADLQTQAKAQEQGLTFDEQKSRQRRALLAMPSHCARGDCASALDAETSGAQQRRLLGKGARVVPSLGSLVDGREVVQARSLLQKPSGVSKRARTEQTRRLSIFYRYADESTAITNDLVALVLPALAVALTVVWAVAKWLVALNSRKGSFNDCSFHAVIAKGARGYCQRGY
jgi:hypothetical protein